MHFIRRPAVWRGGRDLWLASSTPSRVDRGALTWQQVRAQFPLLHPARVKAEDNSPLLTLPRSLTEMDVDELFCTSHCVYVCKHECVCVCVGGGVPGARNGLVCVFRLGPVRQAESII